MFGRPLVYGLCLICDAWENHVSGPYAPNPGEAMLEDVFCAINATEEQRKALREIAVTVNYYQAMKDAHCLNIPASGQKGNTIDR